jgi:HEAT repeat protein/beta-lactamase regulating signal transducer with metallopeptidase domain
MTMQAYTAVLASVAPAAVELALKGALWLCAVFVFAGLLRSASAAARHLVWCLGVAGLFALPLLSNRVPWRIAVPVAVAPDAPRAQPLDVTGDAPPPRTLDEGASLGSTSVLDAPVTSSPSAARSPAPIRPSTILLVVWSAGAVVLLLRLVRSVASVRRLLRGARPCDEPQLEAKVASLASRLGIRRRVRLLTSDPITIPFTTGVLRPVVALPRGTSAWDADKLEAVLLHELAHVARIDLWTSFAAHVACAAYWFNPLVWLAARRMRIEGERACDDAVLRCGARASDYADQLLQVVRDTQNRWAPTVAVAMARKSAFEGRLLAILSPEINRRRLTLRVATPVALGVVVLALPIAAMRSASPNAQEDGRTATITPSDSVAVSTAPKEAQDTLQVSTPTQRAQDTLQRSAVARTLASALKDDDEGVRLAAIQALQSREERSIVPDLIPLLSDPSLEVRRAVVEALSGMPDPRAIAALLQALRSDADAGVRELAAQALGNIDDERAVSGLTAALKQERIPAVRRKIVWALGEIQSSAAMQALGDALRDDDAEVREHAAWGLGEIRAKNAVPLLIPLLRDSNAKVRRNVAGALGELKSMDALDALVAAIADSDAEVRQHVVSALGSLESARTVPALTRALRDVNVDVRRQAISAIGDIEGIDRAPRELVEALTDADVEVRESALHALGHIKDAATLGAIIPLTRSGQPSAVREAAIEALTEFEGSSQVESVLLELMKDADPKIRRLAAQGLGRD